MAASASRLAASHGLPAPLLSPQNDLGAALRSFRRGIDIRIRSMAPSDLHLIEALVSGAVLHNAASACVLVCLCVSVPRVLLAARWDCPWSAWCAALSCPCTAVGDQLMSVCFSRPRRQRQPLAGIRSCRSCRPRWRAQFVGGMDRYSARQVSGPARLVCAMCLSLVVVVGCHDVYALRQQVLFVSLRCFFFNAGSAW